MARQWADGRIQRTITLDDDNLTVGGSAGNSPAALTAAADEVGHMTGTDSR